MTKVFIGIPSLDGKFDARFMDSLLRTMRAGLEHGLDILPYYVTNDAFIHRVRNDIFHTAYQSGIENCFFIDCDMVWEPEDIFKLLLSPYDVIGGSYVIKNDQIDKDNKNRYVGILDKNITVKDGIVETNCLGLGFIKINRKAFAPIYEAAKPFYDHRDGIMKKRLFELEYTDENMLLGEDILFVHRLIESGQKIYIDTNINLGHIGTKVFRGNIREFLSDK